MADYSGGGSTTDFFDTHPGHDKRAASLQALVPRVLPLYQTASLKQGSPPAATANPSVASTAVATIPKQTQAAQSQQTPHAPNAFLSGSPAKPATQAKPDNAIPLGQAAEAKQDKPRPVLGPDSYQIERALRGSSCTESPIAALVDKGPGYSAYEVECRSGTPLKFRCEYGQCVASQ